MSLKIKLIATVTLVLSELRAVRSAETWSIFLATPVKKLPMSASTFQTKWSGGKVERKCVCLIEEKLCGNVKHKLTNNKESLICIAKENAPFSDRRRGETLPFLKYHVKTRRVK